MYDACFVKHVFLLLIWDRGCPHPPLVQWLEDHNYICLSVFPYSEELRFLFLFPNPLGYLKDREFHTVYTCFLHNISFFFLKMSCSIFNAINTIFCFLSITLTSTLLFKLFLLRQTWTLSLLTSCTSDSPYAGNTLFFSSGFLAYTQYRYVRLKGLSRLHSFYWVVSWLYFFLSSLSFLTFRFSTKGSLFTKKTFN